MLADAQAVCLGSINTTLSAGELQFIETLLKVIPRRARDLDGSALRLGLFRTQENMPLNLADPQIASDLLQAGSYLFRCHS
jgi:hypothetical protein